MAEFLSGEEFDLVFENLDFIEPEEDQEFDAAFGDAVNEVCNGIICKINCVCNRPLELHAGLIMFGNVGWLLCDADSKL